MNWLKKIYLYGCKFGGMQRSTGSDLQHDTTVKILVMMSMNRCLRFSKFVCNSRSPQVSVKFIVGNRSCPWPPSAQGKACLPRLDSASRHRYRHRTHRAFQALHENTKHDNHDSNLASASPLHPRDGSFCAVKELHVLIDIHVLEGIVIDQIGTLGMEGQGLNGMRYCL